MAVCEGDAPGPPVEAPRLSEIDSSIYTTTEESRSKISIILRLNIRESLCRDAINIDKYSTT